MTTSSLTVNSALTTNGGGLGAGFDVTTMVNEQMATLNQPVQLLEQQSATLSTQSTELNQLNSELSSLQTAFQQLTNFDGALNSMQATSSDTSQLTATASATAPTGNHTIVVNSLATTSSYSSSALTDGNTTIGAGTFNIQIGKGTAIPVTVSSSDTLSTLAASINSQNLGVYATVITDTSGARLALYSATSGSAGNLTISGNTTPLTFTQAAAGVGKDASLTVDGIPVTSSSNTVENVLPGVTLNLLNANPSTSVQLTVGPDANSASNAVYGVVNTYNTLMKDISSQFNYSPTSGATAPPLNGDSSLQLLQQQLLSDMSSEMSGNGSVNGLADLGVTMNDDGTLSVDNSTLTNALTSQFSTVQNFFQSTGSFGENVIANLNDLTSPVSGGLNLTLTGISQSQTSITSQISDLEATLAVQQQALTAQYSSIDTMLEELPATLAQINSQLGSLTSS